MLFILNTVVVGVGTYCTIIQDCLKKTIQQINNTSKFLVTHNFSHLMHFFIATRSIIFYFPDITNITLITVHNNEDNYYRRI